MQNPFKISETARSYVSLFTTGRSTFRSDGEAVGQLVLCQAGELEISGHDGEWIIPTGYMVYIPADRAFRVHVGPPTSGLTVKFCRSEVSWAHDGCWVSQIPDIATLLTEYALKWPWAEEGRSRQENAFFITLGEMLPSWFQHQRVMWTPYAENTSIQKVINYVKQRGPDISLPEVATHVGMSERNLRRHMQTELGQGWREFIRELRMNKAMVLLGRERKSVTETAFEVGFSSSSAFSNAFLNYVGKSPSAFIKAVRNKPERVNHH